MVITKKTILVRNLEIALSIGVHEEEKTAPQRLLVSVEADLAGIEDEADNVGSTVDYDRICDFIRELAKRPHIELQETVARQVLEFTLALPGVSHARVETRKPDIFPDCEFVAVRLTGSRSTPELASLDVPSA